MTNQAPFALLLTLSSAETALPYLLGFLPLHMLTGSNLISSQRWSAWLRRPNSSLNLFVSYDFGTVPMSFQIELKRHDSDHSFFLRQAQN